MACWQSAVKWVLNNVLLTRTGNEYERFAPESAVKWVLNNVLLTSRGHKHEKFAPKCAVKWGRAGWQMWDHVDGFGGHLHQKVVSDTEAFSLTLFNKHSLRPKKDGAWPHDACLSSLTNIQCENMKGHCRCHLAIKKILWTSIWSVQETVVQMMPV